MSSFGRSVGPDDAMLRVQRALKALYEGSDMRLRRLAHEFLLKFQKDRAAWSVAMRLLDAPEGSVQALYYGANTLYLKLKDEWGTLREPAQRKKLLGTILRHLAKHCGGGSSTGASSGVRVQWVVATRLALAAAQIAVRSDGGAEWLLRHALAAGDNGARESAAPYAVTLMSAVPEEAKLATISHNMRLKVRTHMRSASEAVVRRLRGYLAAAADGSHFVSKKLQQLIFECFIGWMGADVGVSVVTLDKLGVLDTSNRLGSVNLEGVLDLWTEALDLSRTRDATRAAADADRGMAKSAAKIMNSLTRLAPLYERAMASGDVDICRKITIASSTIGEQFPELVAAGSPDALTLTALQLRATEHPSVEVSEISLEFWLSLQDIDMESRHPMLRAPIYRKLFGILIMRVQQPATADADEYRDFRGFRDKVSDVLITSYYALGTDFFKTLAAILNRARETSRTAAKWRMVEAAAFALHSIGEVVADTPSDSEAASRLLALILSLIRADGALLSQCYLCNTIADCAIEFGASVGTSPWAQENVFRPLLQILLKATRVQPPKHAVFFRKGRPWGYLSNIGDAFAALCAARATKDFFGSDKKRLNGLVELICRENPSLLSLGSDATSRRGKDASECEQRILKGLAQLAMALPGAGSQSGGDATEILSKLFTPQKKSIQAHLAALAAAVARKEASQKVLAHFGVVSRLRTVEASLRVVWMATGPKGGSGSAVSIVQLFWPSMLKVLASNWRLPSSVAADEYNVPKALGDVLEVAIRALGPHATPYIPRLAGASAEKFKRNAHPECLRFLSTAARLCGSDSRTHVSLGAALATVAAPMTALLSRLSQSDAFSHAPLITEFCRLCVQMARRNPQATLSPETGLMRPVLATMPRLLAAVPSNGPYKPRRDMIESILQFFNIMVDAASSTTAPEVLQANIKMQLAEAGPSVARTLLLCIAENSTFAATLAASLWKLLRAAAGAAERWLTEPLTSSFFEKRLSGADRKRSLLAMLVLLRRDPTNSRGRSVNVAGRFRALMVDFARMCNSNGQTASDSLVGYAMNSPSRERKARA